MDALIGLAATGLGAGIGLLIIRFVLIPLGIPSRQLTWLLDRLEGRNDIL